MTLNEAAQIARSRCGSDAQVKVTETGGMYTATIYSMTGCTSRYLVPVGSGRGPSVSAALLQAIHRK